jgi:hypothetical protein
MHSALENALSFKEGLWISEVIITIAEDGSVTGSFSAHIIEVSFNNQQENCSGHWEQRMNGSLSGQLTGAVGLINSTENWSLEVLTDCPDASPAFNFTFSQPVNIEISGDLLTGVSRPYPDDPDGVWMYRLTATKQ